jgi:prepilin-type N-terminal cleavage/methylation domain-containing protein
MRTTGRRRQRGVTLMEMMVVMAIVSVVFIMSYSLLQDAAQTSLFLEEHSDLPIFAQGAVNAIQRELMQSRVVFDGASGSFGPSYLSALQIPAALPLLTGSALPVSNPTGTLVPDGATRYTGNVMLLARQLEPAPIRLSNGSFLNVDRYVFEIFYLTRRTTQNFSNTGGYIDAIWGKSDTYADYFQLQQWQSQNPPPSLADKQTVNNALLSWVDPRTNIAAPTVRAWDSGQSAPTAFFSINPDGSFSPVASPTIALPAVKSLIPALASGRVSGKMNYSIGFRPTATTVFPFSTNYISPVDNTTLVVVDPVPKYALYDSAAPTFPDGMEFLIVGPAGSRRILSRIVLIANYGTKFDSKESLNITSAN